MSGSLRSQSRSKGAQARQPANTAHPLKPPAIADDPPPPLGREKENPARHRSSAASLGRRAGKPARRPRPGQIGLDVSASGPADASAGRVCALAVNRWRCTKGKNRLQGRAGDRIGFEWPPEARKERRTARKPPTHPKPSPSRKTRQKPGNRPANYRRTRGDSGLATVASWPGLNLSPTPRRPGMYFGCRLVFCSM